MTEAKFEQFSAWLDGYEPAPEGEWDQASLALEQLGEELRKEQILPEDFARRTAERVLTTVPVPWLLRRVWSPKPLPFACLSLSTVAMPWLASALGRPWQLGLALGVLWFLGASRFLPRGKAGEGGLLAPGWCLAGVVSVTGGLAAWMLAVFGNNLERSLGSSLLAILVALGLGGLMVSQLGRLYRESMLRLALRSRWLAMAVAGMVGGLSGSLLGLVPRLLTSNLWFAYGPATDLVSWTGDWSRLGAMVGLLLGVLSAATVGYDELPKPAEELGRLVKKAIIGVLISSATFGLAGWAVVRHVLTVQMVEPEWVGQLQIAMTEEMMAPIKPEQNGYAVLEEVLDREAAQASKAPYLALTDFYQVNLEHLPPELVGPVGQAVPAFEAILPRIGEAVARPEYSSMAVYGFGPEAQTPDFQTQRGIVKGLVVLGLYRESQGDVQAALDAYLLALDFGTRESGTGVLVHEMVCVNNVLDVGGPLTALANSGQLSPAQWRQLGAGVEGCKLDPLHFGKAMDHEYLAVLRLFDRNTSDEFPGSAPAFLLESERTAYTNLFFGHRSSFYSLNSTATFEEVRARFPFSVVMPSLLPNITRAQSLFCEALTRLEGLRTMAALENYRQQRGHYPEQLEALERPAFDYLAPRKKNRQAVSGPIPGVTEAERLGLDDLPTLAYERVGDSYHLASRNQDWDRSKWSAKGVFR